MPKINKVEVGEQMELIDVLPKKARPIVKKAQEYRKAVENRQKWGSKEAALKAEIGAMIADAKISRLANGVIRFSCDGVLITQTPRKELLQVQDAE